MEYCSDYYKWLLTTSLLWWWVHRSEDWIIINQKSAMIQQSNQFLIYKIKLHPISVRYSICHNRGKKDNHNFLFMQTLISLISSQKSEFLNLQQIIGFIYLSFFFTHTISSFDLRPIYSGTVTSRAPMQSGTTRSECRKAKCQWEKKTLIIRTTGVRRIKVCVVGGHLKDTLR